MGLNLGLNQATKLFSRIKAMDYNSFLRPDLRTKSILYFKALPACIFNSYFVVMLMGWFIETKD